MRTRGSYGQMLGGRTLTLADIQSGGRRQSRKERNAGRPELTPHPPTIAHDDDRDVIADLLARCERQEADIEMMRKSIQPRISEACEILERTINDPDPDNAMINITLSLKILRKAIL